jgi:hypothetical protein
MARVLVRGWKDPFVVAAVAEIASNRKMKTRSCRDVRLVHDPACPKFRFHCPSDSVSDPLDFLQSRSIF